VHDAPVTTGDHALGRGLRTEEQPLQVDVVHLVPLFFGYLERGAVVPEAGVVDENVDPAKVLFDTSHALANRRDATHIHGRDE
jgi:hypothetical protein